MSALALGTVQFGLDYGIKNERGRVPESEVFGILRYAREAGIDTIDTASAYGDSEAVLGRTMGVAGSFHVVSKLPTDIKIPVRDSIFASLERMGLPSLYGYLLHSFDTWEKDPSTLEALATCRDEGIVAKIGVSLYRPEEAERLMDAKAPLDLVQVPYNLLDRRFERVFCQLREYGTEIHVRSAFLQGLLFIEGDKLHPQFSSVLPGLDQVHGLARRLGVDVAAICLGFVAANPFVDKVVIGVDNLLDLKVNMESFELGARMSSELAKLPDISTTDEMIILPFNWK